MNEDIQLILDHLKRLSEQISRLDDLKLPRYLSIKTAAHMLDVTEGSVRSMIKRREISFYKMGKRVRIRLSDLQSSLVKYPSVDETMKKVLGG